MTEEEARIKAIERCSEAVNIILEKIEQLKKDLIGDYDILARIAASKILLLDLFFIDRIDSMYEKNILDFLRAGRII